MFRCLKVLIAFVVMSGLLYVGHGFILEKAVGYLYYKDELKPG